ncbi:TPA: phage repressor protein CI [Serratia marcescens]|uniref:phage repressor protein CI n=1 Tax=Serratia marcescens TaxID=615 RepID=UPI0018D82209|nr:phage repressor protein CI [Serratia marcescens]MBH3248361.1 phage repressor protein CI [Serratia marcescens]MBN5431806.1 phage repressor protein CI [Serratia marcescens]MDM1836686.1 helix-turn-helix domain-containing protein [Serratia marcescens]MDM1846106.1 helix-turn-helix domain-containing protein [Serratia marcescens]MDP8671916.1 phage repressor protein CI [Serratia marcescens]
MSIDVADLEPIKILERICEVYGFSQKIQLANHFDISASSLQNRYTRGTISYDYAAFCSLETGASLKWLLTGEGSKFENTSTEERPIEMELFTIENGGLTKDKPLNIDPNLFRRKPTNGIAVRTDGKLHFIDKAASLADGTWLVDIEGVVSIREITVLPAKKLHVAGGKIPFECSVEDIQALGLVVGIYNEVVG